MPIFHSSSFHSFQKGQTLLVIVLIMVVALTVVLSIATRSITNTRISSDEENSQRAFSAAEAGVERALKSTDQQHQTVNVSLGNNSNSTAQLLSQTSTDAVLNGGQTVNKDEGVDLWLSDYSPDSNKIYKKQQGGNFKVRWEDTGGACSSAAIEVVVLSGPDTSSVVASHSVFDPCGARQGQNQFTWIKTTDVDKIPSANGNLVTFTYSGSFSVPSKSGLIPRIIPLYANTKIGVSNMDGIDLPQQGNYIVSTGTAGGTTRKISVFQQYPKLPIEVFPYAIFAP